MIGLGQNLINENGTAKGQRRDSAEKYQGNIEETARKHRGNTQEILTDKYVENHQTCMRITPKQVSAKAANYIIEYRTDHSAERTHLLLCLFVSKTYKQTSLARCSLLRK